MRTAAAGLFNTVYEAEGAVRDLCDREMRTIDLVARNRCTRKVLAHDLQVRERILFGHSGERIEVADRLPHPFLDLLHDMDYADARAHWYRHWLNDDYILVIAYLDETRLIQARNILRKHHGVLYRPDRDVYTYLEKRKAA